MPGILFCTYGNSEMNCMIKSCCIDTLCDKIKNPGCIEIVSTWL